MLRDRNNIKIFGLNISISDFEFTYIAYECLQTSESLCFSESVIWEKQTAIAVIKFSPCHWICFLLTSPVPKPVGIQ